MSPKELTEEFVAIQNALDWSNAQVAARLKVHPATISRINNGINPPSESLLEHFRLIAFMDHPHLRSRLAPGLYPTPPEVLQDNPGIADVNAELFRAINLVPANKRSLVIKLCLDIANAFREKGDPSEFSVETAAGILLDEAWDRAKAESPNGEAPASVDAKGKRGAAQGRAIPSR